VLVCHYTTGGELTALIALHLTKYQTLDKFVFYEFIAVDFYREFIYWKMPGSPGFWFPAAGGLYLVNRRWKIAIATTMDYGSCAKKYYPTCKNSIKINLYSLIQ
jgi:hypothetical protein